MKNSTLKPWKKAKSERALMKLKRQQKTQESYTKNLTKEDKKNV